MRCRGRGRVADPYCQSDQAQAEECQRKLTEKRILEDFVSEMTPIFSVSIQANLSGAPS